MRAVSSNPIFPCIHKNKYELRMGNDFKWSEVVIEIEKEICESLDEALDKHKSNGVAYWQTDATIKSAALNTFVAECPKMGCGGIMIETEVGALFCDKCSTTYNTASMNVRLAIDVNAAGNAISMVTTGQAGLDLLKV